MGRTKKATAAAPPKPLPAEGKGRNKRTPQSTFDPAKRKDIYEPEKIIAERLSKGQTQYLVKWAGYAQNDPPSGRTKRSEVMPLIGTRDRTQPGRGRAQGQVHYLVDTGRYDLSHLTGDSR